jgi:hypothetical protein
MLEFEKYQHIEKIGSDEVAGILDGEVFIFPKIDGSNGNLWCVDGNIQYGSRRRHLTDGEDNQGFKQLLSQQDKYAKFFAKYPNLRLFGEFLKPHTLKTYRDDAWNRFYIFDVTKYNDDGSWVYLTYNEYQPLMEEFGLDYIPPIKIITYPSLEQVYKCLEQSNFLVQDGAGNGEGIVIKRYDYKNKYGRITWAKVVTSEFKEKHYKTMGAPKEKGAEPIEVKIANEKCTEALIEKTYAKILAELDDKGVGWSSKNIPQLLNTVFHDFVQEEIWDIVKDYKQPTINFKQLASAITMRIKQVKQEIF